MNVMEMAHLPGRQGIRTLCDRPPQEKGPAGEVLMNTLTRQVADVHCRDCINLHFNKKPRRGRAIPVGNLRKGMKVKIDNQISKVISVRGGSVPGTTMVTVRRKGREQDRWMLNTTVLEAAR